MGHRELSPKSLQLSTNKSPLLAVAQITVTVECDVNGESYVVYQPMALPVILGDPNRFRL